MIATIVTLWTIFVRAPSPVDVCDHIVDVTMSEAQAHGMSMQSEASMLGGIKDSCVQHKLDKIQLRGRIKYATYAKCVLAAPDLQTIEAC